MGRKYQNRKLRQQLRTNDASYVQYYDRLMNLSVSSYVWKNMPDTVDTRFLEMTLFGNGMAVFFKDESMDRYLCLPAMINSPLNVYNIPIKRIAYANNGYRYMCDAKNSVLIYNNLIHTNDVMEVEIFARRLYDIDATIDVNCHAQKTPILINCSESQRQTMIQLYSKYDGNTPVIFGNRDSIDLNGITVLQTGAPFIAPELQELKTKIYNEALTYLGISNMTVSKKERLVTDEVQRSMGGVFANRYSRMCARENACKEINRMFGLNISVEFRENVDPQGNPGNEESTIIETRMEV